jgi:AcrR family transcriptional regulator
VGSKVRSTTTKRRSDGEPAVATSNRMAKPAEAPAKRGRGSRATAPSAPIENDGAGEAQPHELPRAKDERSGRYRRLPTGAHSLDPEEVRRDQRERLQLALIELIAERGFQAVRILDLTKLARVSRPTFYSLYKDKEDLFLAAFDEIAKRSERVVGEAYLGQDTPGRRLRAAMLAFAELAAAEPEAVSLLVLGAFGAGPRAFEHRNRSLEALERTIYDSILPATAAGSARKGAARGRATRKRHVDTDLSVRMVLGGIREVTAARLRERRADELPGLTEELFVWAATYPTKLPAGLEAPPVARRGRPEYDGSTLRRSSERARQAEGRLPSGRHDLPRQFIVKNQRERIVDATAEIVAEKGLSALTIPDIARRANVSHQTFYEMYPTKQDAFLGAQKVGLHQALGIAIEAYDAFPDDWPRGAAAGLRALLGYLASEPAHAHLTVVDTFAASPLAIEIRDTAMAAFAAYIQPGFHYPLGRDAPKIAPEAIAGGVWQILHHYVEHDMFDELPDLAPPITFFVLAPFLGSKEAAKVARKSKPSARK